MNKNVFDSICWIVTNVCALEPYFQITEFTDLCSIVDSISFTSESRSINHALYALRSLSDTKEESRLVTISNLGCIAHLIGHLGERIDIHVDSFLKILGNLASAQDEKVLSSLLELEMLEKLPLMMNKIKECNHVEIAWLLSNVAAGNVQQIRYLNDHSNLVELMFKWADASNTRVKSNVRLEATFTICNMITGGDRETIMSLLERGAL